MDEIAAAPDARTKTVQQQLAAVRAAPRQFLIGVSFILVSGLMGGWLFRVNHSQQTVWVYSQDLPAGHQLQISDLQRVELVGELPLADIPVESQIAKSRLAFAVRRGEMVYSSALSGLPDERPKVLVTLPAERTPLELRDGLNFQLWYVDPDSAWLITDSATLLQSVRDQTTGQTRITFQVDLPVIEQVLAANAAAALAVVG